MTFCRFFIVVFLTFGSLTVSSCTSTKTRETQVVSWISHENWLAVPLDFNRYSSLRAQIEGLEKINLKHRGEAHITVVSPPEYEQLKSFINIDELESLFKDKIMNASWHAVCVGSFQKNQMKTFYVVVKSDDLQKIRREIKTLAKQSNFDPENYHPHITLGFTEKDLHLADGAVKNDSSCMYPLAELNFLI